VDTRAFSPEHRSQEWRRAVGGEDKVIATFVGRLVWEKNLMLLAEAYQLLRHRDRVKMVIVGDGPARAKLQELMPDAYFTGQLSEKDLPPAYASSDIFVFPSVTETFGNVTVEAMASGLPAICAAAGGACDIVNEGENGLLVSAEKPQDLASALDHLVENPGLRARMAENALQSISRYQWNRAVASYETMYRGLIAQSRRASVLEGASAQALS
jgi:glycosyltransferase involved in cell wall biosynthesis